MTLLLYLSGRKREEEMEESGRQQARGSLCKMLEERQVGKEEPLSGNTAGFGD